MLPREVERQRVILNRLFSKIAAFPVDDLEIRSHWARYLCVLIEGHVEVSVRAILEDYIGRAGGALPARRFAESNLRRFQNPNMQRILDLLARFDPSWAENVRVQVEGRLKDAVDSVAALRNLIAHGQSAGLTYAAAKDYYGRVSEVVDLVGAECQA